MTQTGGATNMRLGRFLAIAVLAVGCGDPKRSATTTSTTPSSTTRTVAVAIAGPRVHHSVRGDLQAVVNLPALQPITNVAVVAGLDANQLRPPPASAVPGIMALATPLPPTDPVIDQWQYPPWYIATFTADGQRWALEAYLGGLALLTDDAGRRAMVRLHPRNGDGL